MTNETKPLTDSETLLLFGSATGFLIINGRP